MGKGKSFNDFTYGVGLEVNATSFKQVKDDLKLNLDNLSKMVKSYGKVLKIDPNADLSKLFEEMRKIQSIVDGINGSDNSFSGFVDKGTLGRIAELENSLQTVSSMSKETKTAINDLQNSIAQMLEPLKSSGEIKLPGTFNDLFGDAKNKTSEIKNVTDQIKQLESAAKQLESIRFNLDDATGLDLSKNKDISDEQLDVYNNIADEFLQLSKKLKSASPDELSSLMQEYQTIVQKMTDIFGKMSTVQFEDTYIDEYIKRIDGIITTIKNKKQSLTKELKSLQVDQAKYTEKLTSQTSVKKDLSKSLGLQSEYNAQVKVTPKTNDVEWINKINNTIKNIEPRLNSIKLKPTFSNSSDNLKKEMQGNLAQINHAINVDLQVNDNIEQFNQKIQNIDASIKNARQQLEKQGNFKIRFEYEEGGKFKDAAYKIINQFKRIDAKFYIANGKKFIQDVVGLKEKATKELSNIPINIDVTNQDSIFSGVDTLRAEINEKIGNIGVNLTLQNIPQFMAQAAMMRDSVEKYYNNHPIASIVEPGGAEVDVKNTAKSVVELSNKAKDAQNTIEKIKNTLKSLSEVGFKSEDFLKLGAFDQNLKYVKGSKEKVKQLLQEYEELYSKVYASKDELRATYGANEAGYAAYREDLNILKQMETMLNAVLQSQIQYTQSRLESTEKILAKEMQIVETKKEQSRVDSKDSSNQQSTQQLGMSAEEATKKIRSLNGTLTQQKKVLKDLEANKFDASSFAKLGEWDKETNSFKKNSQEIKQLINRYKELREARIASGGKTATGEEASIRGKLAAILREQKKHVVEIINKNQAELESVKQISAAYKEMGSSKSKVAKTKVSADSTKHIDELTAKLNKAKETLELLKSKKLDAVGSTGLKDPNKYLASIGSKQSFNDLIKLYNDLIAKKKELENAGKTGSAEYEQYGKIYQEVEKHMGVIYQDQLKYTQSKIQTLETQIAKEKEILQLKTQQTKEDAKQSGSTSNSKTNVKTGVTSTTVKLDGTTLNSLAKDATLKAIDGKINSIVNQLGKGVVINGSNISPEASNVSVSTPGTGRAINSNQTDVTTATQKLVHNLDNAGKSAELFHSKTTSIIREMDGETQKEIIEYKSRDNVRKHTETYGWVTHGKEEPPTWEHKGTIEEFNEGAYNKLRQQFIDAVAKYQQIKQQIVMSDGSTSKLEADLEIQKGIVSQLSDQLKLYPELYTQESRRAAIAEANKKAQQELSKIIGAQKDKGVNKQNNDISKIVNDAQSKLNGMQSNMQNLKLPMAEPAISKLKEYEQLLTRLKQKQKEIASNPDLLNNENYNNNFVSLLQQMQKVQTEFTNLQKTSDNFLKKIRSTEDVKILDSTVNVNNMEQMHDVMQEFANQAGVGKAKLIEFNDAQRTATFEINNGKGQVQQLTVAYDTATNSLGRYTTQTKTSLSESQKFFNSLKHSFQNVARYIASFGSVYRIFAMLKQGVTYVKEIDSALTELKKVTDETDASYNRFLQDMSKTAGVVGSTVSELTTMAAEWARLGYSMEEAGKLAESTAILLNVSEFEDATKASEALISTMQAFQYTADESQHVVDILNEVGNNFAVSSDGIATALQDSASALMEAGNDLEQATALVAAANKVVQDPNSVGSALRTISLRLRGTSVEILEQMGEETDGAVESVSKLQEKLEALTGVDIVDSNGAYKDTYTILKEIGEVWKDLDPMDQAAALELMAGKNRANTLAAILNNMEDLKGAYESALNAEGSALRENESHLNSIQGRIDLFNNSVQTMWMNTLDSEAVKFFVSLGTGLINVVDKLDLVRTLIAGIATYFMTFSKNKIDLASILGIHQLDDTFLKGFSVIGKQGLTGKIAELFKSRDKIDISKTVFGDPRDIKLSVEDFMSAIQDNINDYTVINTTEIDSAIDGIQQKLAVARKQLSDAKSRDWNYYKALGSVTPAKDKSNSINEKIQEIEKLETKLTELQAKRDSIVSSSVENVANSMVASIESETQAHQSLLSVLSEVKDMKLYLGDEHDAAIKIDEMSQAAKNGQADLMGYVSSLSDADVALKAYAASVEDGNYSLAGFQNFITQHNAGLKASGIAAKAAAVGHQLLNAALSMGISMLASFAIDLLTKGLDKAITTTKEAAEAAEEVSNKYKESQSTLQKQKETIDELSASYERLSKGVDLDTNNNLHLTTGSYQEYLNICNDIADMYPQLVTGFDAQGNAILSLKGNVDQLIQAYKDAAQAARQQMIAGGKDIFDTFKTNYDTETFWGIDSTGLKQQKELADNLLEIVSNGSDSEIVDYITPILTLKMSDKEGSVSHSDLKDLMKSAGVEKFYSYDWATMGYDVDVEKLKSQLPKLTSFIRSSVGQVNTETSKVKSLMDAYLGEDLQYSSYSNKTRSYIDQIVSNLDAEFINGFDSADALYNHIKTNIVDAFKDVSITDALSELSRLQLDFNKGNISYVKYQERLTEQISKIQNKFDSDTLSQIKLAIGIDEESLQIAEKHIATIVDGFDENGNVIQDIQNKINSLSVEDLQIAGQLEVPAGTIYTWDELIAKIKEAKIAATEDFDLNDYKTAINSVTESISTYQEAIQKLDKGSFTLGDFMELIEEMPELAKGVDISSKSFSGLRSNLQQAIKTSTKSFIRDLKELKYRLIETGKSTESIDQLIDAVENMPDDALDSFIDKYGTLADTINEARAAQEKLSESMNEEETGYETRGEAMEYMKGKLEEGKIGSESNVWNVAEQYGFTYDSSKTINENADALAKYIAVRERWFKEADDGDDRTDDGYAFEGIENFMQDVEEAVKKSEELQQILSWTYDEDTGTLNFDFDNENLDTIIQSLSQTDQLAGLTKEEFIDMIKWVGQYFNINWSDNDDILNYLDGVATSAKDAKTKVEEYGAAMQKYLGGDSTIDLTQRPMVSKEKMQQAGWTEFDGDYATTYSSTYTSEDGQKSIVVTPILPDSTILSPQALDDYAKKLLAGEEIDPKINIKLGEFNGADSQKQADEYAQTLSKAQAQYDQLRDSLNINATIDSSGVEGLQEIKELQETITTNSEGVTIIDQEAFVQVLKDAGYTQDQIDLIIDKIKTLNSNSLNDDLFKIDETLTKQGVSGLKEIESLQSAIKESSSGWTVVDTDMFTSVLQGAGYTKTQIDELIKKIQEYNSVVLTSGNTDPLGLDATNMNIDTLKASLDTLGVKFSEQYGKLGDGLKDIKIDVPDLVTMLNEKGWSEEAIRNYCAKLSETNLEGFQIKVDQKEIDAAIEKANEVPAEKPINVEITGTALTDAQNINSELNKMQDRTVEVTINETTVKKTEEDDGFNLFKPSTWFANGTAHASGTAFAGGNWGAPRTETALTGELGPEILVRGNRWTTVGENGAEFTQVKRGDIIFNHKQSEQLLKNGYVTSRGKAYASGTAYAKGGSTFAKYTFSGDGGYTKYDVNDNVVDKFGNAADKLSDAADKVSDSSDDFKESVDWIEIRIEELNERLALKAAQLENAVGAKAQNKIIDSMIADNQVLYDNLIAGANEYYSHAKTLLGKIPAQFRDAAKNGSIAITEFAGKTSEEAYNAIQEYREWTQKGADATQQAEEVITEIRSLAVQAFDNIAAQYDGENSITEAKNAKLEAAMNRAEERGRPISEAYYLEMAGNTFDLMDQKKSERKDLQSKLNKQVRNDEIEVGGKDYNKMVAQILELDAEIIDLETDIESYQNAINDLHWDNFDTQIERLQNISDETQEVIDLLSEKDLFNETGEWTDEGIASIGLYGQQMENAKLQAAMYADAMATLTQEYENGLYSESEYADQMAELKKGHYGAIKSYNDAEDAIIDMNKARVEAIKEGIDKEIEAYEKLIKTKQDELTAEKDLHDFRKKSQETTKNIADIERQLAALAGDNSMAAQAKRARLEAELAEARTEQDEMYYERSVANQQEALDKERENFTAEKEAEKEEWDKSLEDTKAVITEAFKSLEENAAGVNTTLTGLAEEYGLKLSDAIIKPWNDGATTMGTYWSSFTTLGSDAITGLTTQLDTFYKSLDVAEKRATAVIEAQNKKNQKTMEEKNPKKPAQTGNGNGNSNGNGNGNGGGGKTNNPPKAGATVTVKKSATHFGPQSGSKKMASFVPGGTYTVYETMGSGNNTQVLIGKNGAYTGWIKLTDIQGYAKGTTGINKNQWALIDELGEELVLQADGNGRLKYMTKGSSVVPHDITENLMSWGELDPSNMLEQNRPSIGVSPEVHNTEINLDCSVGTLVNIEHCDQGTLPDVEKMVNKAFEKHMQNLNNNIKRYTR